MSEQSRARLAAIVREPACDVAEAALLACVELEPDLDVDAELLRLDALADGLRTSGLALDGAREAADALAAYLGGSLGFRGDPGPDPAGGLLTHVLDRRRGLSVTLSIVYVAVASRAGIRAFGIDTPGHVLVGVADRGALPVVVDPFHGGERLDLAGVEERVRAAIGAPWQLAPSTLRPAPAPAVVRRLLADLTRQFRADGDLEDALWTVELRRLLPDDRPEDLLEHAGLLFHLGRYRTAIAVVDEHLARGGEETAEVAALALRARAKMN